MNPATVWEVTEALLALLATASFGGLLGARTVKSVARHRRRTNERRHEQFIASALFTRRNSTLEQIRGEYSYGFKVFEGAPTVVETGAALLRMCMAGHVERVVDGTGTPKFVLTDEGAILLAERS